MEWRTFRCQTTRIGGSFLRAQLGVERVMIAASFVSITLQRSVNGDDSWMSICMPGGIEAEPGLFADTV